jgi:hypothetical protein
MCDPWKTKFLFPTPHIQEKERRLMFVRELVKDNPLAPFPDNFEELYQEHVQASDDSSFSEGIV